MSLKNKTLIGIMWNALELLSGKFIQIVITIILARILTPEDFGIIALLVIFTELSKVLLDSGFSQALIRRDNNSDIDYNSVFYFNIFIGIIIYIILFVSAPFISDFYEYPALTDISRIIFLTIIINSFSVVQNAIVIKDMNFKILAKRTIISNFVAGLIAVYLAYEDFGVWALVNQMIIISILRVILLWSSSPWKPSLSFSTSPIKELFPFSKNILFSGFIDVLASNIQVLLIGKFYSQAEIGFYSQAKLLSTIPSQTLTSIVKNVTFPSMSKIKDEKEKLKTVFRKIISLSVYIVFPFMLVLIAIAEVLIPLLLGNKWIPAIDYFMLLCIIGAIYPLYTINQNIFLASGNSKLLLNVSIAKRVITILSILITIKFGVLTLVIGQVISTVINTLITMYYSGKEIDYTLKEQFEDLQKIFYISIIMFTIIYYLDKIIFINDPYIYILIKILIAFFTYILFSFIFRIPAILEIKDILLKIKNKGSK